MRARWYAGHKFKHLIPEIEMINKNHSIMITKLFCEALLLFSIFSCNRPSTQPKYLGNEIPFNKPEIFGKGFISVDSTGEGIISVTADGEAMYFVRYYKDENGETNGVRSLYTRFNGTTWTELKDKDREMFYKTPQFVNDSLAIMSSNEAIWKSTRQNDSIWSKPVFIDSLDLGQKTGVTDWGITKTLELFYVQNGDLKTAQIDEGKVLESNSNEGFKDFKTRHIGVAPNGNYLICDGFIEGINNGWVDNYISFRITDYEWTYPVHLDSLINTKNQGNYLPRISPDGEVFFFSRQDSLNNGDIYWISTREFEKYKNGLQSNNSPPR